jgi:hypothetical protein
MAYCQDASGNHFASQLIRTARRVTAKILLRSVRNIHPSPAHAPLSVALCGLLRALADTVVYGLL